MPPRWSRKWQASVDGGEQSRWRRDSGELYYMENTRLMAVVVSAGQGLTLGQSQKLFESTDLRSLGPHPIATCPTTERFVTTSLVEADQTDHAKIHLVQNWYEEFRDRDKD